MTSDLMVSAVQGGGGYPYATPCTTHFRNEPELVYKICENSINDKSKSADLPSTF